MLLDQTSILNKREYLRRYMTQPIALHTGGASFWQGKTINISNGGASVQVEEHPGNLMKGSLINFWMSGREYLKSGVSAKNGRSIPSTVVRVKNGSVALRFNDPGQAMSQLNAILLASI